ncbi:MAG TPA: LytR C-terminal domain-containing protein [Candidatus Woesebacteria bacterium]|nr:LytR C-terminal domain-containing protein [Candidatus Woesebacteria bacterium]
MVLLRQFKESTMFLRIFIIIIVVGLLAGGGYYFWQSRSASGTAETEITPTPERERATPTPEDVEKDAFSIEIQNGSGIAGEAGRAQELLEGEDFNVISTANADNYDYEETVIQASSDVSDAWIDELIAVLEQKYTVQTRIDDISGNSDADVIVIVGSLDKNGDSMAIAEESDEVTPTPEDSESPTETPTPSPTP